MNRKTIESLKRFRLSAVIFTVILGVLCFVADSLGGGTTLPLVTAQLLGALLTGAGVQTSFPAVSQLEAAIVIGDVDTAIPISGLSIDVDGKSFINITGVQTLLAAWAKWKMKAIQGSAVVGMVLRVATGRIVRPTTYRLTNAGATTPNVYAFSDSDNGIPIDAATGQINGNSNQTFENFSALFLQTPANVLNYVVTFSNGFSVPLTTVEMDAYFASQYDSEANGELGGVTTIDNTDQKFRSIQVNTTASALVYLKVAIPEAAWKVLKKG